MQKSNDIKLTQLVSCGGCAAKINPIDLYSVLSKLPKNKFSNLLVGFDTGDDACVYKQDESRAIIFTTDFIAPIVDNPFDFGRVAATNALSDIYAMGGEPFLALNIVCYDEKLGNTVLEQIMLGGAETCGVANVILGGGHTVKSSEIRYGLAVIGYVHPDKIITNANGKPDDVLVLTKKLGTGILSQALKNNLLDAELSNLLTNQLFQLNDTVSKVMQTVGITCATDVTGFGLVGHLHKLTKASNCNAEIFIDKIPVLPKVVELSLDNIHSGIVKTNETFVKNFLVGEYQNHPKSKLLFDPQTSGGMLMCVPKNKMENLKSEFDKHSIDYTEIGKLTAPINHQITIRT